MTTVTSRALVLTCPMCLTFKPHTLESSSRDGVRWRNIRCAKCFNIIGYEFETPKVGSK